MVTTAILNGGMYVKMGQGLSTMNHILPKEFYTTLRCLQTEALRTKGNDLSHKTAILHKSQLNILKILILDRAIIF